MNAGGRMGVLPVAAAVLETRGIYSASPTIPEMVTSESWGYYSMLIRGLSKHAFWPVPAYGF